MEVSSTWSAGTVSFQILALRVVKSRISVRISHVRGDAFRGASIEICDGS